MQTEVKEGQEVTYTVLKVGGRCIGSISMHKDWQVMPTPNETFVIIRKPKITMGAAQNAVAGRHSMSVAGNAVGNAARNFPNDGIRLEVKQEANNRIPRTVVKKEPGQTNGTVSLSSSDEESDDGAWQDPTTSKCLYHNRKYRKF